MSSLQTSVVSLSLGFVLAYPSETNACPVVGVCRCARLARPDSLGPLTAAELIGSSRAVFSGRVRSTIVPKSGAAVALVVVERVWHGAIGETASVIFHGGLPSSSDCDIELSPGDQYLFVLSASRQNTGTDIDYCSGTQRLAAAESTIRILGPGRPPG